MKPSEVALSAQNGAGVQPGGGYDRESSDSVRMITGSSVVINSVNNSGTFVVFPGSGSPALLQRQSSSLEQTPRGAHRFSALLEESP